MIDNFYTLRSREVYYQGAVFDSQLELRFVLSIEATHAWLRDGLEMYYDLHRLTPGIKEPLRCYRPDFLIRNWETGEAQLVEIKPEGYTGGHCKRNRRVTGSYINRFGYDWRYSYIYGSQIRLSISQEDKFRKILQEQRHWKHKPCGKLLQNNTVMTDMQYDSFVRQGVLPIAVL